MPLSPASPVSDTLFNPNPTLTHLVSPHVDSYNWLTSHGFTNILAQIPPHISAFVFGSQLRVYVTDLRLAKPAQDRATRNGTRTFPLMPAEARAARLTYSGKLTVRVRVEFWSPVKESASRAADHISSGFAGEDEESASESREVESESDEFAGPPPADVLDGGKRGRAGGASLDGSEPKRKRISADASNDVMTFHCKYVHEEDIFAGLFPIMVGSAKCNTAGMTPEELASVGEEEKEVGGHFISNGLDKVLRLHHVTRRNTVFLIDRSTWATKMPNMSTYGAYCRCVREDQRGMDVYMHYMKTGHVVVRFLLRGEYYIPVGIIMRALCADSTDQELYERVVHSPDETFLIDRLPFLFEECQAKDILSHHAALVYLGGMLRGTLQCPGAWDDAQCGDHFIKKHLFIHLPPGRARFEFAAYMLRRTYLFAAGKTPCDDMDTVSNAEALLPGHVLAAMLSEKLGVWLGTLARRLVKTLGVGQIYDRSSTAQNIELADFKQITADSFSRQSVREAMVRAAQSTFNLGTRFEYLIATGTLVSVNGLGLQEKLGFSVAAERINFLRYIAMYRMFHRGASWMQAQGSDKVRKLKVESFGFLCPVHTPDGGPCGLLNHLAALTVTKCAPNTPAVAERARTAIIAILAAHGMLASNMFTPLRCAGDALLDVLLDGEVLGYLPVSRAQAAAEDLRRAKLSPTEESVPSDLSVALSLPMREDGNASGLAQAYPYLMLSLHAARLLRPVRHLASGIIEMIDPVEQQQLDIAIEDEHVRPCTTHREVSANSMLSAVALLTPFQNHNQSPRCMYQCQMAKQTLGSAVHSLRHHSDSKMYSLQTPQLPIVRTTQTSEYGLDDLPQGTNALVAVISYTSYDMEDAMIVNKGSLDRGFTHGTVYRLLALDAMEAMSGPKDADMAWFSNFAPDASELAAPHERTLDAEGLPAVGTYIATGAPVACVYSAVSKSFTVVKMKGSGAYVEDVRILNNRKGGSRMLQRCRVLDDDGQSSVVRGGALSRFGDPSRYSVAAKSRPCVVAIRLREPRKPIVGDKFSSRHGQKGTLGRAWPQEDMPMSESGCVPDIIINPHAFPSRMTIGMLIESMAGKAGVLGGIFQDSATFRYSNEADNNAVDYFGSQLRAAGFNYHGNEPMYGGTLGYEFRADVFFGIVYYQRLRHMVSDKIQFRTHGPVNRFTRQPVHGRKEGGGTRFGEMERDALISHGASRLLHDRLMVNSDGLLTRVCRTCGSILTPVTHLTKKERKEAECLSCGENGSITEVYMPFVVRYLSNELAAMNIKLSFVPSDAALA